MQYGSVLSCFVHLLTRFWWERSEVAAQKESEVQYGFVLRLSHSCRCVKEGVNFLCDVLVCSFICFNQCLMPSPHTKLCSSFYFGCQLCQAFLAYMLLRMVCMEMIGTVSFCCVSSFQFLWASLMTF